jgi:hypothetical protein
MAITTNTIKDDHTFKNLCDMLSSHAERIDNNVDHEARMRSKPAQRKFTMATANYSSNDTITNADGDSTGWQVELIAALVKQALANDPTFLEKAILDAMHSRARRAFLMLQHEVAQLKGILTLKTSNMQVKEEADQTTPKQYGSVKTATKPKPPLTTANVTVDVNSKDNDKQYNYNDNDKECMGMLTQIHPHPYFEDAVMVSVMVIEALLLSKQHISVYNLLYTCVYPVDYIYLLYRLLCDDW